jgi:hypothetical protein
LLELVVRLQHLPEPVELVLDAVELALRLHDGEEGLGVPADELAAGHQLFLAPEVATSRM